MHQADLYVSGLLGGHARFVHWHFIQISLANLVVIMAMILMFVAALVVPFPGSRSEAEERSDDE